MTLKITYPHTVQFQSIQPGEVFCVGHSIYIKLTCTLQDSAIPHDPYNSIRLNDGDPAYFKDTFEVSLCQNAELRL